MHSSYPKNVGEALPLASTTAERRQCEQRAVMALRRVSGIGDVGVARLLREHGDALRALQSLSADRRDSALHEADGILETLRRLGGEALVAGSDRYPSRLLELADAPQVIYVHGTVASSEPPAVAIVGTRAASAYGLRVARAIATACAHAGVTVVSGLARGIDGAAHEAGICGHVVPLADRAPGVDGAGSVLGLRAACCRSPSVSLLTSPG